jgi:ABC-2 type transport system permease protein
MPFRYITDLPFRIYTGHIIGMESFYGIIIEIGWIIVLLILGRIVLEHVQKKVVVFGG